MLYACVVCVYESCNYVHIHLHVYVCALVCMYVCLLSMCEYCVCVMSFAFITGS